MVRQPRAPFTTPYRPRSPQSQRATSRRCGRQSAPPSQRARRDRMRFCLGRYVTCRTAWVGCPVKIPSAVRTRFVCYPPLHWIGTANWPGLIRTSPAPRQGLRNPSLRAPPPPGPPPLPPVTLGPLPQNPMGGRQLRNRWTAGDIGLGGSCRVCSAGACRACFSLHHNCGAWSGGNTT